MDTFIFLFVVMMVAVGIVLLVRHLLSKPTPAGPPAADLAKAMKIVWNETYGRTDTPPEVTWIESQFLNCGSGNGWEYLGTCVAGLSWTDSGISQCAWPKPAILISVSSFAHELCHHYLARIGQPDPNHTGPGFAPGGIKDQANMALKAAGL